MCLAIPTQITAIDDNGIATVELGGVERQISLIMTPEAKLDDYVLVHTGYAITLMEPGRGPSFAGGLCRTGRDPGRRWRPRKQRGWQQEMPRRRQLR